MILRLSGADFSANNIGKININNELSEDTKELLSKFSKSLTTEQKFAVQEFIEELKLNGIWNCISGLYLPILANDNNEALVNIKTKNADGVLTDAYDIVENGVTTTTESSASGVSLNSLSQMNMHLFAFNTVPFNTEFINEYGIRIFTIYDGSLYNYMQIDKYSDTTNVSATQCFENGRLIMQRPSYLDIFNDCRLFGGVQRTDVNTLVGKVLLSGTSKVVSDNTITSPVYILGDHLHKTNLLYGATFGLFSIGTAMTDEQVKIYSNASAKLMSAMGVQNVGYIE